MAASATAAVDVDTHSGYAADGTSGACYVTRDADDTDGDGTDGESTEVTEDHAIDGADADGTDA